MNRNESKYFHTAVRMDEALLSLLEKKDFAYITVKEVCAAAGVNRSTFYLHYENTADLLREATRYLLDKHISYYRLDREGGVTRPTGEGAQRTIYVTREYLVPYLTFIRENRRVFRTALRRFDVMNMKGVYEDLYAHVFGPILAGYRVPEEERGYVIKFYLTGVFAIVMEWLEGDCADSLDRVADIIIRCVLGGREHEEAEGS